MALARLALRNLQQKLSSSSLMGHVSVGERSVVGNQQNQRWNMEVLRRSMASSAGEQEKGKGTEVRVSEKKSSRLFPRRRGRKSLWRSTSNRDFVPSIYEFFPSGLGNALMEATENINRLLDGMNIITPSQLMGRVKEEDDCYKLRYEVPGLTKDDVKITVEDGILKIRGEHKAEEQEGDPEEDEEFWSEKRYGYHSTSLALPEDAKVDEIKAEIKNGVLTVVVPKSHVPKKDVKEIAIH
ncbi:PREDICTED: 26.5 kDa heat shock protein, mitochondrial [Tarenaya hassleriana]|uniref:26.5 kDa heat shock protein, mitochondrial n=1 Tax=Tarenaya hassleriana TaxID=28532 RepID=UPI00053C13E8|nr:PREDICTED: 26.5 kDa heat shock protein, mitochondrial [Tarenaya hassleriana]